MSAILSAATDAEVGGERVLIVAESFGGVPALMDAITSQTEPTRVHRAYGGEELRYPSGGRIVFATRRSTMRARGTAFDVVVLTIRTWENTQARADIAPLIQTSKHGRIVIASEL